MKIHVKDTISQLKDQYNVINKGKTVFKHMVSEI